MAMPSRLGQALFVDDRATASADDAIEIKTETFVLSRSSDSVFYFGEYASVVRSVGKQVPNLVSGDAVIALCLDNIVSHSRLVIPYYHAIRRPNRLSATASGLLQPTLAAIDILQDLVHNLKVQPNLLIHSALSDIGRATIATSTFGGNVAATANVIINRSPLNRPSLKVSLSLDIIVVASRDPLPDVALTLLKPFGHIVSFPPACPINIIPKLHRNVTVHYASIWDLLQERTDLVVNLMKESGVVLRGISIDTLKHAVQNVSQPEDAMRHINLGIFDKIIIQANLTSLVRVATPPVVDNAWSNANASYIVAGGMGDLGGRFLILLAKRGARHLVTVSRRTTDPHDKQTFELNSRASTPHVSYTLTRLGVPPVRGVIQAAAYLLGSFKESRCAIDSPGDYAEPPEAVRALIERPGVGMLQQVQETDPDKIADSYEHQVYLERREPLPETGQFTFAHPVNAPQHSQAARAAMVTLVAIRFSRHLAEGKIPTDTLNDEPLSTHGRDWLFYATRLPGNGVDKIERFAPNDTVATSSRKIINTDSKTLGLYVPGGQLR
ncbi:hypothetical protein F4680DRAFT_471294 [Xylaria scruposa]|nr:hypothetical protein F4680DRAFT_471294 [Xylaria scruposa]